MKIVRIFIWLLVVLLLGLVAFQQYKPPVSNPVHGFTLTSHHGKTVRHTDFAGRFMLVYFGYTYCPDYCPADLSKITVALKMLEADGLDVGVVQPIFITIDSERDTVQQMADTVALYHPSLIGLTGSVAEITKVANTYQVQFEKEGDPSAVDGYFMSHMTLVFLMDGEGRRLRMYGQASSAADIADDLRQLLGASK